jgi:uncharacterized membrane protein HdeD (DUF308 family)
MLYRKNVPNGKRLVRVIAGGAMIGCGLLGLPGMALGYFISVVGAFTVLTGFFGYCPMCSNAIAKNK